MRDAKSSRRACAVQTESAYVISLRTLVVKLYANCRRCNGCLRVAGDRHFEGLVRTALTSLRCIRGPSDWQAIPCQLLSPPFLWSKASRLADGECSLRKHTRNSIHTLVVVCTLNEVAQVEEEQWENGGSSSNVRQHVAR